MQDPNKFAKNFLENRLGITSYNLNNSNEYIRAEDEYRRTLEDQLLMDTIMNLPGY